MLTEEQRIYYTTQLTRLIEQYDVAEVSLYLTIEGAMIVRIADHTEKKQFKSIAEIKHMIEGIKTLDPEHNYTLYKK